jgi:hypothetical protein
MGCNPNIAQSICDAKADYLLAVKDNQPTPHEDIRSYFDTAPAAEVEKFETVGKDHGHFEVRLHTVSHVVGWYNSERSYPGAPCFPKLTTIGMVESRIARGDKDRDRATILYLLPCAFGSGLRRRRTRPLGHRKQIALEPRCNFQ